jgi:hypothetical protein
MKSIQREANAEQDHRGTLVALMAAPMVITTPAEAGYRNGHHYQGSPRDHRHRCGGGNGAFGTIVGGTEAL